MRLAESCTSLSQLSREQINLFLKRKKIVGGGSYRPILKRMPALAETRESGFRNGRESYEISCWPGIHAKLRASSPAFELNLSGPVSISISMAVTTRRALPSSSRVPGDRSAPSFRVLPSDSSRLASRTSLRNDHPGLASWSWVPSSAILPFSKTRMRSAERTVENRCEIKSAIFPAVSSAKR